MEGFSLGPRASHGAAANGTALRKADRRWSASDRARRVSQNDALQALLHEEIEKSGFLTSAGHRAVVQRFLHSDAVDREMEQETEKASDATSQREGLFRRYSWLVSWDGTTGGPSQARRRSSNSIFSSDSATRRDSVFSSAGSSLARTAPSQQARRRSSGSIFSLFSSDALAEIELAAEEADHSDPDFNIAPRRPSQTNIKIEYAPNTKLVEERFSLKPNEADDDQGMQDAIDAAAADGAAATTADGEDQPPFAFSDRFENDFDAEECGWLPWPERRD